MFTDSGRHTYEGTFAVLHTRKRSSSVGLLDRMLEEAIKPEWYRPRYFLYLDDAPKAYGKHTPSIRLSGLPKGLDARCAGPILRDGVKTDHRVRIRVTVTPFQNGLGGEGVRAVGECLEDHEVTPLNPPFPPQHDPKAALAEVVGTVNEAVAETHRMLGQ